MGFGEYPREYNVRIHGPYDPSRYYGKRKRSFNILRYGVGISMRFWFLIVELAAFRIVISRDPSSGRDKLARR